jgi:hypothetical protein
MRARGVAYSQNHESLSSVYWQIFNTSSHLLFILARANHLSKRYWFFADERDIENGVLTHKRREAELVVGALRVSF